MENGKSEPGPKTDNSPGTVSSSWWDEQNQRFFQRLSGLATGHGGEAVAFGWAVAEATFWPVIPDFVLAPLEAVNHRKDFRLLLASAGGSGLGSLLLFMLTRRNPTKTRAFLEKLPLTHAYQFDLMERSLEKDWPQTLLRQPWSGVPAKIVVIVGAEKALFPWWGLPVLILSRAFRMALVVAVSRLCGRLLRRPIKKASLAVFLLYLLFFFPVWWQIVKERSGQPGIVAKTGR